MKKTFRFMAMAVAAIVMAGTTVACDPMDKDGENQEQTGDNTENGGTENEEQATVVIAVDGKQWVTTLSEEVAYCFDFGVNTPGKYIESYISLNTSSPAYYKFMDTAAGDYLIEPETETTGKITVTNPAWGPSEYLYKELTATSVQIQDPVMMTGEYITFTVAEQLIVPQEVAPEE